MLRFTVKDLRPHFYTNCAKNTSASLNGLYIIKKNSMCIKKDIEGVGFKIGNHSHNSLVQSYLIWTLDRVNLF